MDIEHQLKVFKKGAAEIITEEELIEKLKQDRPLNIKLGLDPNVPDVHLGHAVVLRKLKQLQDLGHNIILIIGDFTAMIGDPTGKSETRKQLTKEEVQKNAEPFKEQVLKILDPQKTTIRYNSEWLEPMNFLDVINLASKYTVARMLERETFRQRMEKNLPLSIHEFFYPLMQGYDSVVIEADVELGATEQKFNILMGRTLQKEYGSKTIQVALLMPILVGTDGVNKMSKSLGNYIGINEPPNIMYGKVMSIPDEIMISYYELTTDLEPEEIEEMKRKLEEGTLHPRDAKMRLAREIVKLYHGEEAAKKAEEEFIRVFQKKDVPDDIPEVELANAKVYLPRFMVENKLCSSTSEGMRLIKSGAVKLNGEKVNELDIELQNGDVLQVGKLKFVKVKLL
ncbi:tyrosyl-tRNA synthetase [Caldicellulosiruptor saccharolyticus DSM 8903]|uniref:Tyrosine--tRNA ligase n=1 Tax=Caldicellulosiruptor saccharolyticus (strain ATCC 43494 / DSM 8903 / Tp8T 6331) TaxID=351627 RepID=A4XJI5_CALS8|nr:MULTISPECIES: tyrosine--tRNA ligase [Caldicellulosiruptor]ABP67070.1 tyrosyl-tRNA synthetase [Caldicellulosiruptor saccharolyticus DSM 8903]